MTEDLLELASVAETVFGITPERARRHAALGLLPVPAFRLGNARKGPMYVRKSDMDAHLKERYDAAKKLTLKMSGVTQV